MATKRVAKKAVSSADAIDEQLKRYREMRNFSVTAEPSGSAKAKTEKGGLPFVIQKHAASHLHYDFRLGWNGVLKSWAVAKGPSYDTKDKRLAVQVEDHPMEYGGFEGIIPAGQYGGGTVMLWDEGTWEPQAGHPDVDAGLRDGSLKFTMHGTKVKGNWTLVRMGGKAAGERKPNWLLIKEHDGLERGVGEPCITVEAPNSVVTGRTLEEIAAQEDHVWSSKDTATGNAWVRKDPAPVGKAGKVARGATGAKSATGKKGAAGAAGFAAAIKGAIEDLPEEGLPEFLPVQLAMQADKPPEQGRWLHELKLDGYRIEARKQGGEVQLYTRSGLDWTHRMRGVAAEVAKLPVRDAVLDGEVVVLAENGTTSFAELQASFQEGKKVALTYFVFDLLHVDGRNLRDVELVERKGVLAQVLEGAGEVVRLSEHLEGNGTAMFERACELHAEGIVSKRAGSKYRGGRSGEWLKSKCIHAQEFVVAGFTLPSNGSHGVGALLLGYFDEAGKLIYAGRTGTGFTQKTHGVIREKLEKLRVEKGMLERIPAEAKRGVVWVRPELVAQVHFATWTADDLVRQASFQGLREDKDAREVRREEPVMVTKPVKGGRAAVVLKEAQVTKVERVVEAEHAAIRLTHPEKVLDPESGLTKQQLADYYWGIAEHMLPQISNRPLSLVRCPEGSSQPCFFQKHTNHMLPKGIESVDVPNKKTGKPEPYITLSTRESLAGLAQMGVLEVHPWGSKNADLEHPDRIIVDLDPDAAIEWKVLAESADEVREKLKKLGLESFLKSTGGKGLHVVVPVVPEYDWVVIKAFAHAFVLDLEKEKPAVYLTKMSKAARKDRIYLDYLRNERGATAVAAFSPRARAGAPVSVPLNWADLKLAERPLFYVGNFEAWKGRLAKDPWKKMPGLEQRIDAAKVKAMLPSMASMM